MVWEIFDLIVAKENSSMDWFYIDFKINLNQYYILHSSVGISVKDKSVNDLQNWKKKQQSLSCRKKVNIYSLRDLLNIL